MSLHVLANHMSSKGRNGDSMLVHMTPHEVAGLQALAMKHGGSLTINPDTGLPEANFLKSLLPIIAGFALGPAGMGIAFGGLSSAASAGLLVGGVTGLATGSLSKGLMAGLGAYGGAGLGGGLSELGAGELAQRGISESMPSLAEGATQAQIDAYTQQVNNLRTAGLESASKLPMADKLSAGFSSATASPMDAFNFAKDNKLALGMAAAPIAADMMVPTATKAPAAQSPGRIREKIWDGRQFVDVGNTDASVYNTSGRSFSDLYRGYQGGGIVALAGGGDVKHFAIGGDTKLALEEAYGAGDYNKVNDLIAQNKISEADVGNTWKGFDTAGAAGLGVNYFAQNKDVADAFANNNYGMTQDQFAQTHYDKFGQAEGRTLGNADSGVNTGGGLPALNAAAATPYYFQVNPDVAAEYTRNPLGLTPEAFAQAHFTNFGQKEGREFEPSAAVKYATANKTDIAENTQKWIDANPFATTEQINAAITGSGMSKGDVDRALGALVESGKISGSERYYIQQGKGLSAMADNTAKWLKDNPNATQTDIDAALKASSMDIGDAQQVLAHGFQVADKDLSAATQYIKDNPDVARWITSAQGQEYIKKHPEFDVKDIAYTHYKRYGEKEGRNWGAPTGVVPGDERLSTATTYDNGAFGNYGSGNKTGKDYLGNTVSIATPGDIITNPDMSRTMTPNIPGRDYGGFTGIGNLKSAYTAGGGSLGYTSPVPTSLADFNKTYVTDRMSGDSLAAYEYLTGKKGAAYPTKSTVGQIARPYDEAVLGYPTRTNLPYIYNKATGKMDVNPDYVLPKRDDKGNVTYSMSANDIKKVLADTPLSGQALYDWAIKNSVSAQQIADATGQSLSQVYAQFRVGSKAKADADKKKTDDDAAAAAANSQQESTGLASGGMPSYALGGLGTLGGYSDGGRLLKGPGDGVSDSIPATIGAKQQPARLADGEFVVPARIVSELGNGSTDAGAKKLYAMMDRVQRARGKTTGKNKVAANSRADKYLPA